MKNSVLRGSYEKKLSRLTGYLVFCDEVSTKKTKLNVKGWRIYEFDGKFALQAPFGFHMCFEHIVVGTCLLNLLRFLVEV